MKELGGKTAVVTGAGSGIGRGIAERLAQAKMRLVLADRDAATLQTVAQALTAAGAEVTTLVGDVSRGEDVDALAAHAKATFGKVHLLCNNAGVGGSSGPMWTLSENDWKWTLGVNLWGVIHGIRAFVGDMIAHGEEAHVVNTASIAGFVAPPFMGAYVASKHAVVALSESLARELQAAGARVRVSVLAPAWVKTNIADSERYRPRELANASGARDESVSAAVRQTMFETVSKLVAAGKAPAEIAEHVVRAVVDERFYILPHAEMNKAIERRLREVLDDRYPKFNPDELR
jgi:NAD(P)-dependent dehydrogenase (short-subunit alcohol dehydrogenase family)